MKRRCSRFLFLMLFALTAAFFLPESASAEVTIQPSVDESDNKDTEINRALEEDGHVVLVSGGTYYLNHNIYVNSGQSITATGATIITDSGAVRNAPEKVNYKAIKNFQLIGGTWKSSKKGGCTETMIQFSHGSNITIKNVNVECNYEGHSIEIIACKNVKVLNCTLTGIGSMSSDCHEEQLQIDVATPSTAPYIHTLGAKFTKGQICKNITVKGCTISGARGVCANYAATDRKYINRFHQNITLINNTITGENAEAVALFNVAGAKVKNNRITTTGVSSGSPYSVGLHFHLFGKNSSAGKASYTIEKNTIKGGRQGLYFSSKTSSRFGKVRVKNNKCYAKKGAGAAISIGSTRSSSVSGNTQGKW